MLSNWHFDHAVGKNSPIDGQAMDSGIMSGGYRGFDMGPGMMHDGGYRVYDRGPGMMGQGYENEPYHRQNQRYLDRKSAERPSRKLKLPSKSWRNSDGSDT
jgi:hypothetical protein